MSDFAHPGLLTDLREPPRQMIDRHTRDAAPAGGVSAADQVAGTHHRCARSWTRGRHRTAALVCLTADDVTEPETRR